MLRIRRLEDRGLIERVNQEPQPWQEMIRHAYGGQERYRLMPLLRLMDVESPGEPAEHAPSYTDDIKGLQAIERRAKALPIGPGQIPWQFRLANLFVLPVAWLLRRDSGRLEERLMNLWNRHGLHPPAEVWLTFQKSRWSYLSFGYATALFLLLLGVWYLRSALQEGDPVWALVAVLAWASALPTAYLFIRQRAWWLWLHDERIAALVENALLHFDNQRYRLVAWCVMPNHVHVLIETWPGYPLDKVLHSWKSFTAQQANKLLGRTGPFWAREYYDRFIRDDRHFDQAVAYIEQNPVKAGLAASAEDWQFGSAARRDRKRSVG